MTELYTYEYDHEDRLIETKHSLSGRQPVTIASYQYDELGRKSTCKVNGSESLKTTYSYNIRSWLKSISGQKFKETLYYNESNAQLANVPRFGGGITAMDWQCDDSIRHSYSFTYDGASRLEAATYSTGSVANRHYDTSYSYDLNGNISSIERMGKYLRNGTIYKKIDDISFVYDGNHLVKATNAAIAPSSHNTMYFHDGKNTNVEYEYDQNGNMTKDLNKNILSVQYNCLNLQAKINFPDSINIRYMYSADGRKLKARYQLIKMGYKPVDPINPLIPVNASANTMGTEMSGVTKPVVPIGEEERAIKHDYCGNVVYENEVLKYIFFDGGYVTMSGTTPQYFFYIQDHLGNNRLVVNAAGTVKQRTHYYPFGAVMGDSNSDDFQRYKYNGKELDRNQSLDLYDYGARQYDPILGRFTTMDPLCEKYYDISPYAYCMNNPVNAVDVEGKYISYFNKELGINYIYYNGYFYQGSLKNMNGHLIPSGNRIATSDLPNSHAYRTLAALRKMENSTNEILKKVFDTLCNLDSGIMHRINGRMDKRSHTRATGGQTSDTYINFNDVDNVDISKGDFKDVGLTDYELVGHELKHAYDIEFYKNKQETDKRGVKFTEYETVNFENLIRKEEGNPLRTKYTFEIPSDIWGKVTIWN